MVSDDTDQLPPAARSRIQAVMQPFAVGCFWNWDITREIADRSTARAVMRQLRLHGGKPGWRAAAEVARCL